MLERQKGFTFISSNGKLEQVSLVAMCLNSSKSSISFSV